MIKFSFAGLPINFKNINSKEVIEEKPRIKLEIISEDEKPEYKRIFDNCEVCEKIFRKRDQVFRDHVKDSHNEVKFFECAVANCQFISFTMDESSQHYDNSHSDDIEVLEKKKPRKSKKESEVLEKKKPRKSKKESDVLEKKNPRKSKKESEVLEKKKPRKSKKESEVLEKKNPRKSKKESEVLEKKKPRISKKESKDLENREAKISKKDFAVLIKKEIEKLKTDNEVLDKKNVNIMENTHWKMQKRKLNENYNRAPEIISNNKKFIENAKIKSDFFISFKNMLIKKAINEVSKKEKDVSFKNKQTITDIRDKDITKSTFKQNLIEQTLFEVRENENFEAELLEEAVNAINDLWNPRLNESANKKINAIKTTHSCKTCGKQFKVKSNLGRHKQAFHPENRLNCQYCMKSFTLQEHIKAHIIRKHKDQSIIQKSDNSKNGSKKDVSQNTAGEMDNNIEVTEGKLNQCPTCGKHFSRISDLKMHKIIHSEKKLFNCQHCMKPFDQERYLQDHIERKHKAKPLNQKKLSISDEKVSIPDKFIQKKRPKMKNNPNENKNNIKNEINKKNGNRINNKDGKTEKSRGTPCQFCGKIYKNEIRLYMHVDMMHKSSSEVIL